MASRLSSSGMELPDASDARELDLTEMFIRTKPSLETFGVTLRIIPMLTDSVATAAPAAEPLPLAMLVVPEGSDILTIRRLWMVEVTLLSVTTVGRETN